MLMVAATTSQSNLQRNIPRSPAMDLLTPPISNRSHYTSNQVSGVGTRILKLGDQRLARQFGRTRQKIQIIAFERLRGASLTLGNVARIFANRT
jgi:hypothetical protein